MALIASFAIAQQICIFNEFLSSQLLSWFCGLRVFLSASLERVSEVIPNVVVSFFLFSKKPPTVVSIFRSAAKSFSISAAWGPKACHHVPKWHCILYLDKRLHWLIAYTYWKFYLLDILVIIWILWNIVPDSRHQTKYIILWFYIIYKSLVFFL